MTGASPDADVIVVGAGPVGLYLAAEIARGGAQVLVLERRPEPHGHSRSIGIHPPALEALRGLGASAEMAREGVAIARGWALSGSRVLGSISFEGLPGLYPYVLALPQHSTEAILERALVHHAPGSVLRGWAVDHVSQSREWARVSGRKRETGDADRERFELTARFVVGCDGADSVVRSCIGGRFDRRVYPDSYVMGDFAEDGSIGRDAGIYLPPGGVVESFPLPGDVRRWVVKTPERVPDPTAADLARLVAARVGVQLNAATCTMTSSFGVERAIASRWVDGRIVLAGDSAHVVPPIGGQGTNLGWLDAADLAPRLLAALGSGTYDARLQEYARRRTAAARSALRRADVNVRLGRAVRWPAARNAVVRLMLAPPLAGFTARMFTMDGLD